MAAHVKEHAALIGGNSWEGRIPATSFPAPNSGEAILPNDRAMLSRLPWLGLAWLGFSTPSSSLPRPGYSPRRFLLPPPERGSGIRLSDFLCRSPAQLAVLTARCDLGFAARSAAGCAEPRCHPAARAKNAFKYRGHVEVGIKLRPMQAETGRRDFDRGKILPGGVFKPLCIAWR